MNEFDQGYAEGRREARAVVREAIEKVCGDAFCEGDCEPWEGDY